MDCFLFMGCLKNAVAEVTADRVFFYRGKWESAQETLTNHAEGAAMDFAAHLQKQSPRDIGFILYDTGDLNFTDIGTSSIIYAELIRLMKEALHGNRLSGIVFVTGENLYRIGTNPEAFKQQAEQLAWMIGTDTVGVKVPTLFTTLSEKGDAPVDKLLSELTCGSAWMGLSSPLHGDACGLFEAYDWCCKRNNSSLFREVNFQNSIGDFQNRLKAGQDVTVQLVGDSITWGIVHCTAEETYAAELCRLFAADYPLAEVVRYDGTAPAIMTGPLSGFERFSVQKNGGMKITVVRNGVGGDSVLRALKRDDDFIGEAPDGRRPELMILMFGVNDALVSDPQKFVSPDIFKSHYQLLLRTIYRSNPDTAVVLMTPTYNDFGKESSSCLDEYSERVKEIGNEFGLPVIDLHQVWMKHLIPGTEHFGQREWLAESEYDTTHWTPEASRAMAHVIFDFLKGEEI